MYILFVYHYSKLRAKLGLKPLQVDDGVDKENGTYMYTQCMHIIMLYI